MDDKTIELSSQQLGYKGFKSLATGNKTNFISYCEIRKAIAAWKAHSTHKMAIAQAAKWFKYYLSRICLLERGQLFENSF